MPIDQTFSDSFIHCTRTTKYNHVAKDYPTSNTRKVLPEKRKAKIFHHHLGSVASMGVIIILFLNIFPDAMAITDEGIRWCNGTRPICMPCGPGIPWSILAASFISFHSSHIGILHQKQVPSSSYHHPKPNLSLNARNGPRRERRSVRKHDH